jgi:hypothetical protein
MPTKPARLTKITPSASVDKNTDVYSISDRGFCHGQAPFEFTIKTLSSHFKYPGLYLQRRVGFN